MALDSLGKTVSAKSKFAVSWCLVGALIRCYGHEWPIYAQRFRKANRMLNNSLLAWNDRKGCKFMTVKERLQRADV